MTAGNLNGRPYLQVDTAGAVLTDRYDFKGNLLGSSRSLLADVDTAIDWSVLHASGTIADLDASVAALLEPGALLLSERVRRLGSSDP